MPNIENDLDANERYIIRVSSWIVMRALFQLASAQLKRVVLRRVPQQRPG
jgi:hypothetical protein